MGVYVKIVNNKYFIYYFENKMADFRSVPQYTGSVKACIFDWAGTVCDPGVFAPVLTFQKLFEDEGVPITSEEVRAPMGVHKRLHIQAICRNPEVKKRWTEKHGKPHTDDDAERIYSNSLSATLDLLPSNSKMIKGVPQTMERLRQEYGLKIGSSTGYTSEIMKKLKPLAAAEGYKPDSIVTSDLVTTGRPSPAMIYLNMVNMDVYPAQAVVKVDDTTSGIVAGLVAGCWTVGIAKTGNYVGMTEEQLAAMPKAELEAKVSAARKKLYDSGAHYVIDHISELPQVVDHINQRLAMGLSP